MKRAIWNGQTIAQSDKTVMIEGNAYFPADSVKKEFLTASDTHTTCPWKGVASYYSIKVHDQVNKDAAWYYPKTSDMAKSIEGYIAFWKGVKVEEVAAV
ncbi:MAG: DUF427 domain-containing protein [Bacteroidetes bacterium]|jgi:uncharacterized protein (DUF427 family)|nr:DUF427 domain-containing protein [Bacteroidota bacterium]MDA0973901.1 DUF427 domain-containing protein [Bacteroidota bacterium]